MSRAEFRKKSSRVLKAITILIAVVVTFALVFGAVYLKFGLAGFSGLLGLTKQQMLKTEDLADEEKAYIDTELGIDLGRVTPGASGGRKKLELKLSAAGMTKVMNSFLIEPDTLTDLQIEVSGSQTLKLSAVGNVDLVLDAFGESKEFVESAIGKLPDDVPVYIELDVPDSETVPEIKELKVGATKIPGRLVSLIDPYVSEGLEMLFDNTMGIQLDGLYVEDGQIVIKGGFPVQ